MPEIVKEHVLLAPYTTLGVGGAADYFAEVANEEDLRRVMTWAHERALPIIILGGGSNALVGDSGVRGLVLRVTFSDVTFMYADTSVRVTAGAGVVFDELIATVTAKKIWGLENLSSIPGTVGAVPVQNVGAYGVEVKDVIESVTVYDVETGIVTDLPNHLCAFGYRDSLFKRPEGKKYIIVRVTFLLSSTPQPKLSYKDLQELFTDTAVPEVEHVREAVRSIRSSKFPDIRVVGTAGSFFKNPTIPKETHTQLLEQYPGLPGYAAGNDEVKIALGWVLDHVCGLKGYTQGNVGLYEKQALVLVCKKGCTADEIKKFSQEVIDVVYEKTEIRVEREVVLFE